MIEYIKFWLAKGFVELIWAVCGVVSVLVAFMALHWFASRVGRKR